MEIIPDVDIMPKLSSAIEIPYDLRLMLVALEWTTELADLAGSARKESDALRLALDETLTFLINSYPDAEVWEQIRIEFVLLTDGMIKIAVTNAGPPVHLNKIPQYNPQAPSESEIDGLWYFLACKAVDDLSFENRGLDGWRVVIRKRLAVASFEVKMPIKTAEVAADRKTPFITRLATPEDAGELVDLTYDTYRYSYPGEAFYHETKLRDLLTKGEIISLVVESDGVIVGNSSFAIPRQTPRCAYSCSLMIKPAFRQSKAIIYLLKEIDRYIASGTMDVDMCYGATVTTHMGSQKVGARTGFSPLALHLAVCIVVDFRGMKLAATERETLVICVRFTHPPELEAIYLPKRHHAVMAGLVTQVGFNCPLSAEEALPAAEQTQFNVEEDNIEHSAYLMITELGQDWTTRLQKKVFALKAKGMLTIIILIPAWHPVPPGLDMEMGRLNAVFSGLKPVSAKECYIVYSALSGPVDFDRILLLDPLAHALKEHSRQLYAEIVAE
ncbi:MAG: hypothetical protein A2020_15825 [Lentisphaerae bacterium GWF2_45_14]|nr:MAG: hypothetical protein A2020_15825 [Lentisphaerae bacterium GWF2_45_14]